MKDQPNQPNHPIGAKAKVQMWNSKTKSVDLWDCIITGTRSADDRDYRVDIKFESGRYYGNTITGCAPECVIV